MFFYTAYHFVFLLSAKKNVFATSNASNVGFIVCMLLQFCGTTTCPIGLSMIMIQVLIQNDKSIWLCATWNRRSYTDVY